MLHTTRSPRSLIVGALGLLALLLAACGDNTATAVPATTAAATTAAMTSPTTAAATTAAMMSPTTAAMTSGTTAMMGTTAAMTPGTTAMTGTTAAMTSGTTAMMGTTAAMTPGTTGAAGTGATSGTIKIVSSLPRTGGSKDQTDQMVASMKLALKDAGGKAGNFTITYEDLDDATAAKGQWDAQQEIANANKAINDPDVMIYLGTFNSGAAKVSIPVLDQAGLVMISPANTYPGLTKSLDGITQSNEPGVYYPKQPRNYFRAVPTDDAQGPLEAAFVAKVLNAKTVFVIDDSQTYGKGLADAFQKALPTYGMTLAGQRTTITGKENSYSPGLTGQIAAAKPDAIFFGGIAQQQGGKLISDIRSAGIQVPIIGGDGMNDPQTIKDGGAAANGFYAGVEGTDPSKYTGAAAKWLSDFRTVANLKSDEIPDAYAIYGYVVMQAALDAIKRAGVKDRAAILTAVSQTKNLDTVIGPLSFDQNGDITSSPYAMYQVKDGKFVYLQQIDTLK